MMLHDKPALLYTFTGRLAPVLLWQGASGSSSLGVSHHHQQLAAAYMSSLGGPDLKAIMPSMRPLQKARLAVGNCVDASYRQAMAAVAQYDALRVIHAFCATWDAEAYKVLSRIIVTRTPPRQQHRQRRL
jgi:hypothetical protein